MQSPTLSLLLVTLALTASVIGQSSSRQDVHKLLSLFRNIHDFSQKLSQRLPALSHNSLNPTQSSDTAGLPDSPLLDSFEYEEPLVRTRPVKSGQSIHKRQGAWSYDYGLGGGRFGKRNYGDYGIGGGRFGRDVDHVDLSDASEADLTS